MNEACATCGATIEHAAVTGIFCTRCHSDTIPTQPSWKAYLSGPVYVGALAAALPSVFHITVNDLNYVALACGVVGIIAGGIGLASARHAAIEEKGKKTAGAAVVLALALLRLLSSGILGT